MLAWLGWMSNAPTRKARTFQVLQKAGHCFAKARCCDANDVICSVICSQNDVSHDKLVVLA